MAECTETGISIRYLLRRHRLIERYFYHCFPRRFRNDNAKAAVHGLRVLESIVDHGLLLVPEAVTWQKVLDDGTSAGFNSTCQVRACFTELSPDELPDHSRVFGPFAIEFEIERLRFCGAIPTIYVPREAGQNGMESMGSDLVSGIAEASEIIKRLGQFLDVAARLHDNDEFVFEIAGQRFLSGCGAGAVTRLLEITTRGLPPPKDVVNSLAALTAFFYPTDDPRFTGLLGYYRQREWRIIADMAKHGEPVAARVTPAQAENLLKLDEFFQKEFNTGKGMCRRVDRCYYLHKFEGKHILAYARRVLVPEEALERALRLIRHIPCGPAVEVNHTEIRASEKQIIMGNRNEGLHIQSVREAVQRRAFEIWQQKGDFVNDWAHWFAARRQLGIADDFHV